ncbi:hypothetical protein AB0D38_39005, partial [Streptomyces sp. NPDC048279]
MREKIRTESVVVPPDSHRPFLLPADARSAVRGAVARQTVPIAAGALDDALLVTSELTTNAILHGGGITGFDVDVDGRDNEELRGLLNAGHQRNRPAWRISSPEHKPT